MGFEYLANEEQPQPLYHTSTKSAAKALEEMVAEGDHDTNPTPNHAADHSGRGSRGGARRSSDPGSSSNSSATSNSFSMLSSLADFGPTHGKGKEKAVYQDQDQAGNAPPFPALPTPESRYQGESTPHYAPIPPLPSTPPFPSEPRTRSKSAHRPTHANAKSDSYTSSKKRRGSSSIPSRLLDDAMKYLNLDTDLPSTTSPTNSHPRAHSSSTNRTHKRTRSADSISAMLQVTTERLARETARANDAEKQAGEILSHFRSAHETKMRMERDLVKVREELGMYKAQLDIAQKEIYRAQEIVDRVERERVQAEDEARKSREKIRKLMAERATEHAMEEGRRLGFEEGLRHGRESLQLEADEDARKKERRQARSRSTLQGILSQEETPRSRRRQRSASVSRSSGDDPARRSSSATHARSQSRSRPVQGSPPGVPTGPAPLNTTPAPTRIPSTQPQPQQGARRPSVSAASAPEDIAIQRHDPNAPIHPIPIRNYSPPAPHPPFVRPPDNYIPTLGPDATIHLPPPHDLSSPPPISATSIVPPPPILHLVGQRPVSRAAESSAMAERRERADHKRQYPPPSRGAASRAAKPRSTMSIMSGGSTRLSSLDLLSPPDEPGPSMPRNYANPLNRGRVYPEVDPDSPTMGSLGLRKRRPRASTQPEKMVEQWRSMNRVPERPASPTETIHSRRGGTAGSSVPYSNPRHHPAVERPTSAEPIIRPGSAATIRTPSRRPRDIVLEVPMSASLLNNNAQPTRSMVPSASDQTSTPPPQYERSPNRLRSVSNATTVPGIEIVTPSSHSQSTLSHRTRVDPVLLTPESANRHVPLPPSHSQPPTTYNAAQNSGTGFYGNPKARSSDSEEEEQITMVLPDHNFPAGFVPLSPIPGMANLNPYPPGFAPMSPKPGNFTYPTSPLLRA